MLKGFGKGKKGFGKRSPGKGFMVSGMATALPLEGSFMVTDKFQCQDCGPINDTHRPRWGSDAYLEDVGFCRVCDAQLDDGLLCATCTSIGHAMRNHGRALRARYENLASDEDKSCFLAGCLAVLGCTWYMLVDTGAEKNVGGLQQAEDLQ